MPTIARPILLAAVLAAGCGTTWVAVPANPAAPASIVGGVTLTATGVAWEGDPDDLTEYVTVVAVDIVNQSGQEVRVAYSDFILTDETGFRYAALNPFVTAQQVGAAPAGGDANQALATAPSSTAGDDALPLVNDFGQYVDPSFEPGDEELGGYLVAGRIVRPPLARPYRPYRRPVYVGPRTRVVRPPVVVARPRVRYAPRPVWMGRPPGFHGPWYVRPPRYRPRFGFYGGVWTGFVPVPVLRPWWGPSFAYWTTPFAIGPAYHVWAWSPAYYPSPRPPDDVINLGLPEGVLQPGGRLNGFLYFQQRNAGPQSFALTWNVTDARTNGTLGQARVDLAIVEGE